MLYGQHINQQMLLEEFVFPLTITFWLVEGCYFSTLILFLGIVAPSRYRQKNVFLISRFSWISLVLSLIQPSTPPSVLIALLCYFVLLETAQCVCIYIAKPEGFPDPVSQTNPESVSWCWVLIRFLSKLQQYKDVKCFWTYITIANEESSTSPARRRVTILLLQPCISEQGGKSRPGHDFPVSLQLSEGLLKGLLNSQPKNKARGREINADGEHEEALTATSDGHVLRKSSMFLQALMM